MESGEFNLFFICDSVRVVLIMIVVVWMMVVLVVWTECLGASEGGGPMAWIVT